MQCYCDYDPPEFSNRRTVKAKLAHRCDECRSVIQIGDKYEYVVGKWDGQFDSFTTCSHCVHIREWVVANIPCACWAHGNMMDDLRASIEDAYDRARDEVGGVWFGFLRRVVKRNAFYKERAHA